MAIVIEKITFENYRQYGCGSLSFQTASSGKLSALVAKNGTGKTTLLNAITWCLYGKEYQLSNAAKALPIVTSSVTESAHTGTTIPVSVSIIVHDEPKIIEFKRSIQYKVKNDTKGNRTIIAGSPDFNAFITDNADFTNTRILSGNDANILVKQYFDETIRQFYFFDGERLADFFNASQSASIRESIFNISQLTMIESARNRLLKLHNEKSKVIGKVNPDIEYYTKREAVLTERIATNQKARNVAMREIEEQSQIRDKLDDALRGYEPIKKLQEERLELEKTLEKNKKEIASQRTQKTAFIRKYLVLLTIYPRVKQSLAIIDQKEKDGDLPPAIDTDLVRKLIAHPKDSCPICARQIDESVIGHLNQLLQQYSVSSRTSNYLKEIKGPLESFAAQAMEYHTEADAIRQVDMLLDSQNREISARLKDISSKLSKYENNTDQVNVSLMEEQRAAAVRRIDIANRNVGAARATIEDSEIELAQIRNDLEKALKKISTHAELKKQLIVIDSMYSKLNVIKTALMNEMKQEITSITWKFFDSMIWKQKTFGKITISDNYEISVYNQSGTEMTGSLSATEQVALAYAFTLAIHEASGKNCPLVIDSPLGRVSDENREKMARALKDVSKEKQIIMLFTPDEYSDDVAKSFNGYADVRSLQLSKDETHIEGIAD